MSKPQLADDILRGAKAIAEFTGLKVHQVEYLLKNGNLPAKRVGKVWFTTCSELDDFFRGGRCAGPTSSSDSRETESCN